MRKENSGFISFESNKSALVFDDSTNEKYPLKYHNVVNDEGPLFLNNNASYFLFCQKGSFEIAQNKDYTLLKAGHFLSISGAFVFESIEPGSKMIVIEILHTKGVYPLNKYSAMTLMGRIESEGRLKYIDGCTDSLLIPPIKKGDPCLNHLHFPKGISQTPHTHPSIRLGIVAKGEGLCVTPFGNLPLTEGMVFVIKEWDGKTMAKGLDGNDYEIGNHCFFTSESEMDVIAFHPDSDFGPEDENHPMINRTIVKGVSANSIKEIQTK